MEEIFFERSRRGTYTVHGTGNLIVAGQKDQRKERRVTEVHSEGVGTNVGTALSKMAKQGLTPEQVKERHERAVEKHNDTIVDKQKNLLEEQTGSTRLLENIGEEGTAAADGSSSSSGGDAWAGGAASEAAGAAGAGAGAGAASSSAPGAGSPASGSGVGKAKWGALKKMMSDKQALRKQWLAPAPKNEDLLDGNHTAESFTDLVTRLALMDKSYKELIKMEPGSCKTKYHTRMLQLRKKVTEQAWFNNTITFIILIAAVIVGIQSYENQGLSQEVLDVLSIIDWAIVVVFLLEAVLKLVAEGVFPWRYFWDPWNVFDFVIVVAAFLPLKDLFPPSVLRLLRLLRVLKLVKALPELRMIVKSLILATSSIGYIVFLLVLIFYFFAVFAVLFFGENDPVHFGNLGVSFMTLFRAMSGDDWTELMYNAMYGCDDDRHGGEYGGALYTAEWAWADGHNFNGWCKLANDAGVLAVLFHILFNVIASLIVFNLFVGVIISSVTEVKNAEPGDKLHVTVTKCVNLDSADFTLSGKGSSDPYVKLKVGTQSQKTTVVKGTLNPVYNQSFVFGPLEELGDVSRLGIEVRDWDLCGSDDRLGEVNLNISNMPWGRYFKFEVNLARCKGGAVFLSLLKEKGPNSVKGADEKDKWDLARDRVEHAMDLCHDLHSAIVARKKRRQRGKRKSKSLSGRFMTLLTAKAKTEIGTKDLEGFVDTDSLWSKDRRYTPGAGVG